MARRFAERFADVCVNSVCTAIVGGAVVAAEKLQRIGDFLSRGIYVMNLLLRSALGDEMFWSPILFFS